MTILVTMFGGRFLDHATAISIWICAIIVMSVLFFVGFAWARLVPAVVSLVMAIITWGFFVWLALRDTDVL